LTPPGDVRPAFEANIRLLREIINQQFGDKCGEYMFPDDQIVLMNKIPALDRMDEIIVDGEVIGTQIGRAHV